jgi:hypothetical protein
MSRLKFFCLDMCTESKITRGVTWSCISTYGHKYSPLHLGNQLIWKLPRINLCPIETIGINYGKCITLQFVLKIYTFIHFKNISESERTALRMESCQLWSTNALDVIIYHLLVWHWSHWWRLITHYWILSSVEKVCEF